MTAPTRSAPPRPAPSRPAPFTWDKFSLYELCAQNPPRDARLLRAIHADAARAPRLSEPGSSRPLTLGEDFCGTAALSRAWCALSPGFRAVGIDIDTPTLARATRLSAGTPNLTLLCADVLRARARADLIAVLNFSIGEIHDRAGLLKYLKRCRARLNPGGVFICDIYGGADCFETGLIDQGIKLPRDHPAGKGGDRILYSWEQRSADPLTARVVNAMHFEVRPGRPAAPRRNSRSSRSASTAAEQRATPKPLVLINAFVYHWRLWSIPELRDAMHEAGFRSTAVYPRTAGATDAEGNLYTHAIDDPTELGDSFNVFVVARPG